MPGRRLRLPPHHPRPPRRDIIRRPPALAHLGLLDEAEGAAVPGIFADRAAIAEAAALGEAVSRPRSLSQPALIRIGLPSLLPPAGLGGRRRASVRPPRRAATQDEGDVADIVGARAAGEQQQGLGRPRARRSRPLQARRPRRSCSHACLRSARSAAADSASGRAEDKGRATTTGSGGGTAAGGPGPGPHQSRGGASRRCFSSM